MKKLLMLIISVSMLLTLCSCSKYTNSYSAFGMMRNNTTHSANASFASLNGRLVFQLKRSDSGEGNIAYSVSCDSGEISIFYDIYDDKCELITAKAGENKEGSGGYIESGKTVYIILEATNAKGSFSVELNDTPEQ